MSGNKPEEVMVDDQNGLHSPTLAKLALALSKVQGELKGAVKGKKNPFFGSQYADLAAVWDSCRQPLAKNELAVIQINSGSAEKPSLITLLVHSSGEWIRSELFMKQEKPGAQALGSILTYARRYSLSGMVGVCPIEGSSDGDDDGEGGTKRTGKKTGKEEKKQDNSRKEDKNTKIEVSGVRLVGIKQVTHFNDLVEQKGWGDLALQHEVYAKFGVDIATQFAMADFPEVVTILEAGPKDDIPF